ncbi:eukaryotic translation initiation factor 4E isoform X2 [Drosophila novamexicana]|uniref:eukaryotic translation initiation factor 4E isoform X2 n=1 Tax=Drosophila novamexicana TaxID=47314 RepID=UPI0011E5E903|nr:eukaryotic translation initiation factor 4E isoform X2 [Drosophila novamexicana]
MASAQMQTFESSVFEPNKFLQSRLEQSAHIEKQELLNEREHELESVPEEQNEQTYKIEYKHPLEHVWTLWYLENDRTKHWKDMLNEITQIDSIETFWGLYYTIKTPSELKIGSDYYMFKQGPCGRTSQTSRAAAGFLLSARAPNMRSIASGWIFC